MPDTGLHFRSTTGGPRLAGLTHPLSGARLAVGGGGFFVVLDGRLWRQDDLEYVRSAGTGAATFRGPGADVAVRWRATPSAAHAELAVTAGPSGVRVDQAGWDLTLDGSTRLGRGQRYPPDDLLAPVAGVLEAQPVWIGAEWFGGLDWAAAEHAAADERLLCREFPGTVLAGGQRWTSHALTLGAAPAGRQAEAFLVHLDDLRGRPTRRASFYFDWLTHASEGPTEPELAAMVALFERLRGDAGLAFDVYALDDGAVETRWGLYWDRYRLMHRQRFPRGLRGAAERLAALGTDMGVWIGPDGFGDAGEHPRADDLRAMLTEWNVSLLKIDTCVSWPWRDGEPAANDAYLRRFAAAMAAAREVRPDLVAINHRVTASPYILAILDSTLWEGAESYPDVFLYSGDQPRLHTRYAAYGRGLPTYYGAASALLEDHGVCFNGDPAGWREELCVGAFGRALALSPEVYGTLFLLPDPDFRDLARALDLARAWRPVLSRPGVRTPDGDFVHHDGERAIVCLVNDGWSPTVRRLSCDATLGFAEGTGPLSVVARFPTQRVLGDRVCWGETVEVPLPPFGALAIEVVAGPPPTPWADVAWREEGTDLVLCGPPGTQREVRLSGGRHHVAFPGRPRSEPDWVDLGELARSAPGAEDGPSVERCRFAVSNDPAEWQVLQQAAPTAIPEVAACRAFFREKLRREGTGVAANAWDGDPTTAGSDASHWRHLDNRWRLDLGASVALALLEVDLADFGGGPVLQDGERRGLVEPVWVEASADLAVWTRAQAHVFYTRNPYRTWPSALVAEFPEGTHARYLRVRAQGFAVQDIRVLARTPAGGLAPVDRTPWRGTNLFGERPPQALFSTTLRVRDTWPGRTVAVVAQLAARTPLQQEVGFAWAEVAGRIQPATAGSPRPLFHGYECDAGGWGPGFCWRLPVPEEWVGQPVGVRLGWIGASGRDGALLAEPVVRGYLLSDASPPAEARLPHAAKRPD